MPYDMPMVSVGFKIEIFVFNFQTITVNKYFVLFIVLQTISDL